MPAPGPRRSAGRHVTFLEPSIAITLPASGAVAQHSPAKGTTPSLSLTATPHELEPPTPDVAEDPLRALIRICGFLASNTARAWRGEELAATPPLAGLAPYLDPVKDDLERISEMIADKEEGEKKENVRGVGRDSEEVAAAGESAGAGAHDEPGLVRANPATTYARPPTPTPPSPITPPDPNTSTSTSIPTPPAPASEPTAQQAAITPATTTATATTTTTPGPRKRKDAVLRTKRPSIHPSNADALADADDAAVRAAALISRVTDLGAGLFDGAVRERGAALWTALSRRGTPTDVPVPALPRTRFAAPTGERS